MTRGWVIGGLAAVVLGACGGSAVDTAPPPDVTRKPIAKSSSADAGTLLTEQTPYMYNPVAKRDPFRNVLEEVRTGGGSDRAEGVCAEPLCNFDLDQLTLVAVVSGDANPVGMLEDPTRIGHLVHRNTRVGKQGGKVTQIQRDCVVVTEYFQTPDGKVNPNRVNLCVKADKRTAPVLDLLQNKLYETQ